MKSLWKSSFVFLSISLLAACGTDTTSTTEEATTNAQASDTTQVSELYAYPCQNSLNHQLPEPTFTEDTKWEIGPLGFPVPYSPIAGGCQVLESGTRAGFSHSPAGAAYAATVAVAGYAPGYSQEEFDDIEAKIAHREGFERTKQGAQDAVNNPPEFLTADEANVFGYRMEHYTSEEAIFTVFIRNRDSNEIATATVPLVWDQGDWKVAPTAQSHYYLEAAAHEGPLGEIITLPVTTVEQVEQ